MPLLCAQAYVSFVNILHVAVIPIYMTSESCFSLEFACVTVVDLLT